ncbi:dehydrogenase [Sphaerisporangium krabiense]|uniref:NAD(P)/FAD-dependent oxidoreductase n=1 Tax=Sphaerisporangium krabiense TaxID=763782 RepID=UPI00160A9EC5|nr:FAD-dependent oxidoreductase [Sphaerisporangium krabiense]GII63049.1 dehydrogenase [Sphaerisporangium krabiense]
MTPRVAVVGGGIAGLSTAYHLRDDARVTLFEADSRLGGHANTIEVREGEKTLGLDTAFIVYNEAHYPMLTEFFRELDVPTQDHPGRFSFFDLDRGRSYVSEDFERTEEEIARRYDADFTGLWREARRFQTEAPRDFVRKRADIPLGEYLDRNGYSAAFRYGFVVLIATAAWSVPAERIWEMPASTVIAFFFAHGHEGLGGRTAPWRTVTGGSVSYVRRAADLLTRSGADLRLNAPVKQVAQDGDQVVVHGPGGPERFDHVVLATHADDALAVLAEPTAAQRRLEVIRYHGTRTVLHTDASVMPADRERWRSWNYGRVGEGEDQRSWVVYYLNELQHLRAGADYFVTLDCPLPIREDAVIQEMAYRHPVFTTEVRALQRDIHTINDDGSRIKLAGSYFHSRKMGIDIIGSHESAFDSGAAAADAVRRTAGIAPARA